MKLLFINPNSSEVVTECLRAEADKYQKANVQIDVVRCLRSPAGIVTSADELTAASNVLDILEENEGKYDAAIIGCFADPGLEAAREKIKIPVVGMFEASSIFSSFYGSNYSIIASGGDREISPWITEVRTKGLKERLISIECLGETVESAVSADEDRLIRLVGKCKDKGADSVILGCAAFAGRGEKLSAETGIKVIDGVKESIAIAGMAIRYRD